MPAPFVFVVVLIVTGALVIFFGAWAVAADAEGRELNFVIPGATLQDADTADTGDSGQGQTAFGAAPIGESSDASSGTWWGQGFLKACPLH
jgi:hypothetical protein